MFRKEHVLGRTLPAEPRFGGFWANADQGLCSPRIADEERGSLIHYRGPSRAGNSGAECVAAKERHGAALCPRRAWLLLLALSGVLLASACKDADGEAGRTLVIAQPVGPATLDPARASSAEAAQIVTQIFEPLVRIDTRTQQPRPALALSWRPAANGLAWTFELRRNVFFHDGTPFDADAVVFSFERQRDAGHLYHRSDFSYWHNSFEIITKTEKLDSHRVRIHTRKPFGPLLENLSMYPVSIASPRSVRNAPKDGPVLPVGTGPYRFLTWRPGREVLLARNDAYWGGPAEAARLLFRVVEEEPQRILGLQSGTVDLVHGVSPDARTIIALHPDLMMIRAPGANVTYLAMNTLRPPFNDLRVRRAFNHAINKALVVKLGYQGLAVAADGPLPPTVFGYTDGIRRYRFDPMLARRLLAEAAFDFSRTYRLYVMSTPRPYLLDPVLVARILASNLREVGVRVDPVVQSYAAHMRSVGRGEHDLCLLGWVGDNSDPDNFLHVLLDRENAVVGAAQNVAFFRDAAVHRLLVQAREDVHRDTREGLYRKAQQIIADQAPWVPLTHSEVTIAAHRRLSHIVVKANNIIDFSGVRFVRRAH